MTEEDYKAEAERLGIVGTTANVYKNGKFNPLVADDVISATKELFNSINLQEISDRMDKAMEESVTTSDGLPIEPEPYDSDSWVEKKIRKHYKESDNFDDMDYELGIIEVCNAILDNIKTDTISKEELRNIMTQKLGVCLE